MTTIIIIIIDFILIVDDLQAFFQSKPEFGHIFEVPATAKKITQTTTTKPKSQ